MRFLEDQLIKNKKKGGKRLSGVDKTCDIDYSHLLSRSEREWLTKVEYELAGYFFADSRQNIIQDQNLKREIWRESKKRKNEIFHQGKRIWRQPKKL